MQPVLARCLDGGQPLRQKNQQGDGHAHQCFGQPGGLHRFFKHWRQQFGEQHHGHQRHQQKRKREPGVASAGTRGIGQHLVVGNKVAPVPHQLDVKKKHVEHKRNHRHKDELGPGKHGSGGAYSVGGQDHREHRKRHQHGKECVGCRDSETLLVVTPAAQQQAHAQDAVQCNE